MPSTIIPPKLQEGDEVRVIAPSDSGRELTREHRRKACKYLESLGLHVTFGAHFTERNILGSSSLKSRLADFHAAFRDPRVKAVLPVYGGFPANELLPHLDYELIRKHPKILCGYSDITALACAITAKTGLITYSGPSFRTFARPDGIAYTTESFIRCLFREEQYPVVSSAKFYDYQFKGRTIHKMASRNQGYGILQNGKATGRIIGGNLCTLNLLQGTPAMPSLKDSIIFIEDDHESKPHHFARDFASLCQVPSFKKIRGIVIGRFQRESGMTERHLRVILANNSLPRTIPIIIGADFGHTSPRMTFPNGGIARIEASSEPAKITILTH